MTRNTLRIGVVAGHRMSSNFLSVLGNLADVLDGCATCDLIVGDPNLPARIGSKYTVVPFTARAWPGAGFLATLWACWQYCRRYRPDVIVNASKPETLGLVSVLVGRCAGVPSVVRMTGELFGAWQDPGSLRARVIPWIAHTLMAGLAYRFADRVAPVGARLRDDLLARVRLQEAAVTVLPQPIDVRRFTPLDRAARLALRHRLGMAADRRIVLFVGRVDRFKGADRLIDVVRRVSAVGAKVQFCVLGDGDLAAALGAFGPENVRLHGRVPHDAIHAYFQAADVLILPSRTEGLPNAILEALACGLPVIAAPVGDIPNWISNLATLPEDYARRILTGDWVIDRLPEHMTWEGQKAAYETFFRSLCSRPD